MIMIGGVTKARNKPRNVLRGIVPTASAWDTAPTNLDRITDGDYTTETGEGSKASGGGAYGYLSFDLGASKLIMISGLWSTYSSTGNTYCYLSYGEQSNFSDARTTLLSSKTGATTKSAGLSEPTYNPVFKSRYIRLQFNVSTTATAYAVINQLAAHELSV